METIPPFSSGKRLDNVFSRGISLARHWRERSRRRNQILFRLRFISHSSQPSSPLRCQPWSLNPNAWLNVKFYPRLYNAAVLFVGLWVALRARDVLFPSPAIHICDNVNVFLCFAFA